MKRVSLKKKLRKFVAMRRRGRGRRVKEIRNVRGG